MPFEKGNNLSNGRPKGSANKVNNELRDRVKKLIDSVSIDKLIADIGFKRIVIAIDPAVTSKKKSKGDDSDSDETSITVVGLGDDDRGYVLDNKSGIWTPDYWARGILPRRYLEYNWSVA